MSIRDIDRQRAAATGRPRSNALRNRSEHCQLESSCGEPPSRRFIDFVASRVPIAGGVETKGTPARILVPVRTSVRDVTSTTAQPSTANPVENPVRSFPLLSLRLLPTCPNCPKSKRWSAAFGRSLREGRSRSSTPPPAPAVPCRSLPPWDALPDGRRGGESKGSAGSPSGSYSSSTRATPSSSSRE